MPVNILKANGITQTHVAERLQINLLSADEDVSKMQLETYFNIDTYVGNEKIVQLWDSQPLIFDCVGDDELKAAMEVIQARIGQKRYEQQIALLTEEPPITGATPPFVIDRSWVQIPPSAFTTSILGQLPQTKDPRNS